MNKTDLINQLAERLDGDKKAAQAAVEGFIDLVQREVQKGRNVSISGFGVCASAGFADATSSPRNSGTRAISTAERAAQQHAILVAASRRTA